MWSRNSFRSATFGVLATAALGLALTALSTEVLKSYGGGLFVVTPYALGLFAALAHGRTEPRALVECLAVGSLAVGLASAALIALALEGAICIVMALPLTVSLGMAGAFTGWLVQRTYRRWTGHAMSAVVLVLPLLLGVDAAERPVPPLRSVTTAVVIDAPPAVVWQHVVEVSELPPPHELVFRVGIAYPTRAVIVGRGLGAVRRCRFSTGDFVEPITAWQPGRRLEFDVTAQPAPMRELSPWGAIEPPHLDGFLRSERGRFMLVRLPHDRTLLRGTTWYRNRMWPQTYWGALGDALIHRIHGRVLTHIRRLSEASRRSEKTGLVQHAERCARCFRDGVAGRVDNAYRSRDNL
jgi:Polyketide cyclase / dehydrase and lipid transport